VNKPWPRIFILFFEKNPQWHAIRVAITAKKNCSFILTIDSMNAQTEKKISM